MMLQSRRRRSVGIPTTPGHLSDDGKTRRTRHPRAVVAASLLTFAFVVFLAAAHSRSHATQTALALRVAAENGTVLGGGASNATLVGGKAAVGSGGGGGGGGGKAAADGTLVADAGVAAALGAVVGAGDAVGAKADLKTGGGETEAAAQVAADGVGETADGIGAGAADAGGDGSDEDGSQGDDRDHDQGHDVGGEGGDGSDAAGAADAAAAKAAGTETSASPFSSSLSSSFAATLASDSSLAAQCSDSERSKQLAAVASGESLPEAMQWECGIEHCGSEFVSWLVDALRAGNRSDVLNLRACDVLRRLENRTVWFVGDSQQQYFYRALKCMLRGFVDWRYAEDANVTSDAAELLRIEQTLVRPDLYCCGVAVPFCTRYLGGLRLCLARVNKIEHMVSHFFPNLALLNVTARDVMSVNNGLWTQREWTDYAGLVRGIGDYVMKNRDWLPTIVWRETNAQHFLQDTGEYPDKDKAAEILGEGKKLCGPIANVSLRPDGTLEGSNRAVLSGGWRNAIANPILEQAGIAIQHTWNQTVPLWGGHVVGECTHFCHPGTYSLWIAQLYAILGDLSIGADLPEPPPKIADPNGLLGPDAGYPRNGTDGSGQGHATSEKKEGTQANAKHHDTAKGNKKGNKSTHKDKRLRKAKIP